MAILERILYPSTKVAVSVYVVVLAIMAILIMGTQLDHMRVVCFFLGLITGWTAHVVVGRSHVPSKPTEFIPLEQNLQSAKEQLEKIRSSML